MPESANHPTIVIVAAGRGVRAGGTAPKQYRTLAGRKVIEWTEGKFAGHPKTGPIILVVHSDEIDYVAGLDIHSTTRLVAGGATRAASVRAGLEACETPHVLIHDVARPCISYRLISRMIETVLQDGAAAPALPVTDALWQGDTHVTGTQDRAGLYRAQTPQGFKTAQILDAHQQFQGDPADDVEVARAAGIPVTIVEGEEDNLKITTPSDFDRAEQILLRGRRTMDIRTGNGFDVHRFGDGDHVMLCGVAIPHTRGLQGHSDADVGLHTITDAIYGALAEGDIGQHFPPSDPQWKGAESHIFLTHAVELATSQGFTLTHVDCTLICEFPKIGPHTSKMRSKLQELLDIDLERISVKATTSERLGFTGRGEGIACMATATLVKL